MGLIPIRGIPLERLSQSRTAVGTRTGRNLARVLVVSFLPLLMLAAIRPVLGQEPITVPVLRGYLDRFPPEVAKRIGVADLKKATSDSSVNAAGTLLFDAALDRGYQMWAYTDSDQPSGMSLALAEVDLGDYKIGRIIKIPDRGISQPGPGSVGTQYLATIDTKNHKLYFQTERGGGFLAAAVRPEIVVVDLKSFTYTMNEMPPLIENGLGAATVFGMEYDEISDTLIMVLPAFEGSPFLTGNPVALVGWRAEAFDGGVLTGLLGPRVLRNCRRDPINAPGLNTDLSTPIMITQQPDVEANLAMKTWVFMPCMTTPVSFSSAIVRLNQPTLFDPNASDERLIPAPPGITNWAIDAKRGRMLLVNESEGSDGWVYEAATNSYIGVIQIATSPSGRSTGFGVDEGSGRLYAFNQSNGLMIAEMGQDPIPQADPYRLNPAGSSSYIPIDAIRNRVFLLPITTGRSHRYEIYEVPPPGNLETSNDPDSLTKQVREEPGKTAAQYGGSATAYGVRSLLAGGVSGAIPSFGNDSLGRVVREVNTRCGLRDREVVLASISQTELQNSAREAKAAGVQLDNASIQDLERPSRCDVYNEVGLGFALLGVEEALESLQFSSLYGRLDENLPKPYPDDPNKGYAYFTDDHIGRRTKWEYTPATCGNPTAKAGSNADRLAGPTKVTCTDPAALTASSEGRAREDQIGSLLVSVGKTYTNTKVWLDPKKGLVSEATAVVENFKIDQVTIGYIQNKGVSFAKGRSGTAGADTYQPIVAGIRGPGITGCVSRCDLDTALPMLNTALAGRAEFRVLKPDPALLKGSPGGYQAGVIKSEKQRSSDNALVGDKSSEVPALEVIIYNDNPRLGRIRQVIQLAGVHVDSQYGIQVFDEGSACLECMGQFDSFGEDFEIPGEIIAFAGDVPEPKIKGIFELARRVIGGIAEGIQVLLANPREAAVVATVWALLLGPYIAWRRRRLLGAISL